MRCVDFVNPWKADRTACNRKTAEAIYYLAVVGAIAVGILGAHGVLGQNFQNFMHTTLSHHLPVRYWAAIGFGAAILPQLIYKTEKIYQHTKKSPLSSRSSSSRSIGRKSSGDIRYEGL